MTCESNIYQIKAEYAHSSLIERSKIIIVHIGTF